MLTSLESLASYHRIADFDSAQHTRSDSSSYFGTIDNTHQGQGLGRALFRDAALRVVAAADTIGIRGIVVHAISPQARDFYLALGFDPFPLEPMTLAIALKDINILT